MRQQHRRSSITNGQRVRRHFVVLVVALILVLCLIQNSYQSTPTPSKQADQAAVQNKVKQHVAKANQKHVNNTTPVKSETTNPEDNHKKEDETQKEIVNEKQNEEVTESSNLLLVVATIVASIMLTYLMLTYDVRYLPESIATILVGGCLGVVLSFNGTNIDSVFRLDSSYFFLFLLPPIIFESGYTLSKRDFFANFGSIMVFSVFGTLISALVIGVGLGVCRVLPWIDSLVYGAILSAIDPVATLAIFQTVEVESTLSTLVFGESVLNDAISIVLYKTFYQFLKDGFTMTAVLEAFTHFTMIFFGSIAIGALMALFTALMFKHMNFRKFPTLEVSLMFVCCYAPYLIGEGLSLSGILAILGNAIVNSHYTHFNLTEPTQMALQQTFHAMSFLSETVVFAYLGLAVFSYTHKIDVILIIVALFLCMVGRAANVFPLSFVCNKFRTHKISNNAQIVMWFSGLRGAIAFSLSLTLPSPNQNAIVTTTLLICLLSMVFMGGGTLPLLKYLYGDFEGKRHHSQLKVEVGDNAETLFNTFDEKYMRPFFCTPKTTSVISQRKRRLPALEMTSDDDSDSDNTESNPLIV